MILLQLHVIFGPAILSQLHEICCTEFNVLNISVGHVPATFSCVCAAFDFVPPNMFPLHVASEHTTEVFYHCKISLHHDSSYLQTLTNDIIFSQMSHTSQQRIKRSRSHWLESFFYLLPQPLSFSFPCLFTDPCIN